MSDLGFFRFDISAEEWKVTSNFLRTLFTVALVMASLSGCATSGGVSPVRYTPINTQEIVLSPYYLSDPVDGADHAWYMKLKISDKRPVAGFLKPNQMLMESFTRWIFDLNPQAGKTLSAPSQAIRTGCQGDLTGQFEHKASGEIKGVLAFSSYADDCSLVLNGSVPFSGKLDVQTGAVIVEFSTDGLTALLDKKNLQYGGDVELAFNAFQGKEQVVTVVSDLVLSDDTGFRYRLKNMKFVWDYRGDYTQASMAGEFDWGVYGSVVLTTASPIQIHPKRGHPFDGALLFHGADDSWIRVLFAKPAMPGFFRIDGSDGFETIGQL